MTKQAVPDPTRCPICNQTNQCTLANPATATGTCWCFSVTISKPMLSSPLATENPGACLCPDCAQAQPAEVLHAP